MVVLDLKCAAQLRITEVDVTLNVAEISGQRVRLGLAPPTRQALDLRAENTTEPLIPEVKCTEHGYQVVVWVERGASLWINERAQIRVVSLDVESVQLGIIAPPSKEGASPQASPRPDGEGAEKARTLSPELLTYWVKRTLDAYLKDKPRGAVRDLARKVEVSPVTINRWRKGETKVTGVNLNTLLKALGTNLDEVIAAELGGKGSGPADGPNRSDSRGLA
jgi:sRNA-binding carbon storage regulator CsrA